MFSQKPRCDKALEFKTLAFRFLYGVNTSFLRWTVIIYAKPDLYAYIRDIFSAKAS